MEIGTAIDTNGHVPGKIHGERYCAECQLNVMYWQFVTCDEFLTRPTSLIGQRMKESRKRSEENRKKIGRLARSSVPMWERVARCFGWR